MTRAMIAAAHRVKFDYYEKGRRISATPFIPTSDAVVREKLEAEVAGKAAE
jgi:hypothetical protein